MKLTPVRVAAMALFAAVWLIVGFAAPSSAMPAATAALEDPQRADFADTAAGQAPAGVDLDRPLAVREWRLSYRYLGRFQSGNRVGSRRINAAQASTFQDPPYTIVPEKRDSSLHMAGLEWAPHARVTLVVRVPVVSIDETSIPPSNSHVSGVGDMTFGLLVPFMRKGEESTSVTLMIGAPTGSIKKLGPDRSYPMQTGGGSWTMSPGFNYAGRYQDLSWGGQALAVFSLNDNELNYQRGTEWRLTGWLGWSLADWVSTSVRAEWSHWGNVSGGDRFQSLPFDSPGQNPWNQGGQRFDLGPGINLKLPRMPGQRFAIEAIFPLWQDLKGPQLGNTWVLNAAWRMSF
jgi:hypothetical protein